MGSNSLYVCTTWPIKLIRINIKDAMRYEPIFTWPGQCCVSDLCGVNMTRVMFGDCAVFREDKDRVTVIINLSQWAKLAQSA